MNLSYFEIWICSLDFRQDSRKNQCNFIFMQVIWVSMIRYFMDASAELADVAIFENVHDVWNQAVDYSTWLIYIPSILRQSRDNFDHFDLRHIVFLILATLENKICPYDYIFNVLTAFREFRHHSNQSWNVLSWSEFKYSIFVPATKLVFNPRFVRKILLINVNLLAQAWKKFCRWKFITGINLACNKHTKCVANIASVWLSHAWYDLKDINRKKCNFNHSSPRELKLPLYVELWGQRLLRCPSNCIQSNRTRYLAC